ncbi:MAG TPA: hypothetical protein VF347_05050, partial [Candidatus Humimicrobiaceae bacterium]
MIFLLGFLYIFCAAALFVNARKNWLLCRLKRTYPEEDYSNNSSRRPFFGDKKQSWSSSKKQSLANGKDSSASAGRRTLSDRLNSWLVKNNVRADAATFTLIFLVELSQIFTVSIFFKNGILIFISISIFLCLTAFIFIDIRGRKMIQKKENQLEGFLID